MIKITPSVERQRDGRFNLYLPRRDGEPLDQRSMRGQFDSFAALIDTTLLTNHGNHHGNI